MKDIVTLISTSIGHLVDILDIVFTNLVAIDDTTQVKDNIDLVDRISPGNLRNKNYLPIC